MVDGQRWDAAAVPDQTGRTAVITGASSGVGFHTAVTLAERGAAVVLACRDEGRAAHAAGQIRAAVPAARVSSVRLDLGSLASVRAAADQLRDEHPRVDLLVNSAGAAFPSRGETADGFERHLGINHLGHFAFTGLVLDRLLAVPGSRVVTVTSLGHRQGKIDFADLQLTERFGMNRSHAQSKLANLLFTLELQRRLADVGAMSVSVAAHPGIARTAIGRNMPGWMQLLAGPRFKAVNSLFMQDAVMGALPVLRAATDPGAHGGDLFGPGGRGERKGYPRRVEASAGARDAAVQARLWQESERLTGVTYRFAGLTRSTG
jgi:NAD(P)-dependent dehydrogenase (short-subunit alcohol dehydrogenase family)